MISACDPQPQLIPREILFGNPEKASPQISPDGNKIAYLAPSKGVLNIWVRSTDGKDDQPVTQDQNQGIRSYFWAQDSEHLFYMQDTEGDENTHLYRVNLKSGEALNLTPFLGVRVQVLSFDRHFPETLLIAMNRENPKVYDAYRLQWKTGELELAAKNNGSISEWIADSELQVRGALIAGSDTSFEVMIRETEKSEWRKVAEWGFEDNSSCSVIGFSKEGKSLYLIDSRDAPTGRLVRLDLESGEKVILAEDPQYDVISAWLHPDTREVRMAAWIKEKTEWRIFEESIRADIETILNRHGQGFSIISASDDDQSWVLRVESDQSPVVYFLYRRSNRTSQLLFENQPELRKYKLAGMEPITIQSRDGLQLHGYITFPPHAPRKNLPLVLNVHGGPWARDSWGYDARTQWFANRGYICLRINFRGSVTYGKNFLNAGNKEWGGKMQNDLTDAVAWAVRKGYADSKRVAIFGGSYGGYAALAGATFTPDLYQAAISVVGPSNLISFLNTTPSYWSTYLENIYRRVGNPEKDFEFLKARSPYFQADKIRIPILIAQGANDPRVRKAESDQIVEALQRRNIPHEYLLFQDEGHGFAKPQNQLKFYKTAEVFLARYLGGRVEK